jgi:hypothetical protein
MAAPYARSVFGAQTGLGAMDPVELQVDMGAYANRRTDPHAFGAGHQFGPMPGVRGLGQQVVVQRTRLGATPPPTWLFFTTLAGGILIGILGTYAYHR